MRSAVVVYSPEKSLTRSKKVSILKNITRKTDEVRKNKKCDKISQGHVLFREMPPKIWDKWSPYACNIEDPCLSFGLLPQKIKYKFWTEPWRLSLEFTDSAILLSWMQTDILYCH